MAGKPRAPLGPGLITLVILQVLWGLLSLGCGSLSALSAAFPDAARTMDVMKMYEMYPVTRWTTLAHSLLAVGWGIGFVAGAAGLVQRARWARTLSLACAWFSLFILALDTAICSIEVGARVLQDVQSHDSAVRSAATVALVSVGCGAILGALVPVFVIVVLMWRSVREQFE